MRKKRGRPPKKDEAEEKKGWFDGLKHETKHSILAIFSFAASVLFVLAAYGKAGLVGERLYGILEYLFGSAFFLAPLIFFLAGLSFLFSFRTHLIVSTVGGGAIMLFSALGFLDAVLGQKAAGQLGFIVSYPLLKFFDFWASIVILAALFIVSILLMLNVSLRPSLNFKRSEAESDESEENQESPTGLKEALMDLKREIVRERAAEELSQEPGGAAAAEADLQPQPAGREIEADEEPSLFFKKRETSSAAGIEAFKPPPLDLLEEDKGKPSSGDIKANANIIKRTLQNFGIIVEMGEVSVGPSITQYTLRPAEGVKLAKITALHNDLALALAAHPIRIEAPIPGKSLIGIEIPNKSIALVGMKSILNQSEFQEIEGNLIMGLGRDVSGKTAFVNLEKMPHLLIAGSTGSGKSVAIHAMMISFLYRNPPERLRFLMIDPKRVELTVYSGIPHMLTPVITDAKKAILALKWAIGEMERRYELLQSVKVRDIQSYQKLKTVDDYPMPYIIIIIDELADIMAAYPREMEASVVRLAQMSRAVGIHLVVSTQRPSVEVITGLIKANITSRMAFQVASQVDSRTILDMAGAEKLLGNGDMLFLSGDSSKPRRIQGAFVSEYEVSRLTQYLEEKHGGRGAESLDFEPEGGVKSIFDNLPENKEVDDELYNQAEAVIVEAGKASASYLQRRLRIGYARAARLLDILESRGVIGPADGSKPRSVLLKKDKSDQSLSGLNADAKNDKENERTIFESF
ncbi:MAG: DNA translocase FtsK [Patescibacteria group bacterium]